MPDEQLPEPSSYQNYFKALKLGTKLLVGIGQSMRQEEAS
jgi:hypothetical protein